VEIPVDEDGQLKYVRQLGSHALDRGEEAGPVVQRAWHGRRMEKEVATWSSVMWCEEASCAGMLRLVTPRQALGAVVVNDPASPYDGGLLYFEFLIHAQHESSPAYALLSLGNSQGWLKSRLSERCRRRVDSQYDNRSPTAQV
jgi:hypothetical protein